MLWPEESDPAKLSARLSVVLSNIRRVLGGGLVADRDAVQLDLRAVDLDLVPLVEAIGRGDDAAVLSHYAGPVLPEEAYEDWAIAARQRFASAVTSARRPAAGDAAAAGRWDEVVERYEVAMAELGVQPRALLSAEPAAPPGSASR